MNLSPVITQFSKSLKLGSWFVLLLVRKPFAQDLLNECAGDGGEGERGGIRIWVDKDVRKRIEGATTSSRGVNTNGAETAKHGQGYGNKER